MLSLALILIALPVVLLLYAYAGYPALLWLVSRLRGRRDRAPASEQWPQISITVPAYNEEGAIRDTIENLLAADYPADRRQILVVSDASTDRTDAIVGEYADRGVELLRLPERRGKTAAENAAGKAVRGEIVINTDASVRVMTDSLKPLVRAFQDPTVGVASGRDVSVGDIRAESNSAESGYVGYEMWVRSLETRIGSIIGASGCFYAFRRSVYDLRFPEELSRDFASALIAREQGFRSVSVDAAVCCVPRTRSLESEYRRKIRTMARGLSTLWYKRHLLNPFRYGAFSWMLLSHKLCRWMVYPALPLGALGLILLAALTTVGKVLLALAVAGTIIGAVGMRLSRREGGAPVPKLLALSGFVLASNLAGLLAWAKVMRNERTPLWEPTRRPA